MGPAQHLISYLMDFLFYDRTVLTSDGSVRSEDFANNEIRGIHEIRQIHGGCGERWLQAWYSSPS